MLTVEELGRRRSRRRLKIFGDGERGLMLTAQIIFDNRLPALKEKLSGDNVNIRRYNKGDLYTASSTISTKCFTNYMYV